MGAVSLERPAHEQEQRRRRKATLTYLFASIGAFLLIAVMGAMLWWRGMNLAPAVSIPSPALPAPNAREAMDAELALLTAALALQAYHAEHGRYPESLSQLSGGYLSAPPSDPFAMSGPIRYRSPEASTCSTAWGPTGRTTAASRSSTRAPSSPHGGSGWWWIRALETWLRA